MESKERPAGISSHAAGLQRLRLSPSVAPSFISSSSSVPIPNSGSIPNSVFASGKKKVKSPIVAPKTSEYGMTCLLSGEKIHKSSKVLAAAGTLEELIGHIGLLKSRYFGMEPGEIVTGYKRMMIFDRLTRIQKDLQSIIRILLTAPSKANPPFDPSRTVELVESFSGGKGPFFPGSSVLEAEIYLTWTVARRAERQYHAAKDLALGIVPEEAVSTYLNRLNDYLQSLPVQVRSCT